MRPPSDEARDGSGAMFDRIARRYDLLNRLMSLGLDGRWRRALVRAMSPAAGGPILDVATGTADVALALARAYPQAQVTGLDPSAAMLEVGREKVARAALAGRIELVEGDAQRLPFEAASFAGSCIAFGIRNVPDRARALSEMARVTRPGGPVIVLELSEPSEGLLAPVARLHVHQVVPRLGAWLSGEREYRYLQRSIAAFPPANAFAEQMTAAGLTVDRIHPFVFGGVHLFVASTADLRPRT